MSDPATGGLVKALDTVLSLWDRSVALLFALFGICCVLLAAAVGAWWIGVTAYLFGYGIYLTVGAVVFGSLAFARLIERFIARRNEPSFHFIPDDGQSFWLLAEEADGKVLTQIELQFRTTNMSKRALMPSRAILRRPFVWSQPDMTIATEDRLSGLYTRRIDFRRQTFTGLGGRPEPPQLGQG
jgi:hypothetical protein